MQGLLEKNTDKVMFIKNYEHKNYVDHRVKLIAQRWRRYHLSDKINSDLDDLLERVYIEKVKVAVRVLGMILQKYKYHHFLQIAA